eukprot:CAMPEP_0177666056 /NCGR_PEP_ID=MMETSP0447-20121125/21382_1 /TAXON_ID=0 /ORGANISM="Stygamoeba regulata, Strain BSH-02190019" /LENGTH=1567 /DNA_ID=CAMNT_0019172187 /DNA_START=105 /DNA_END=4808 /DNA_ORIENTATION=-
MSGWKEYKTPEGVPYYYNAATEETSWDKPDAMKTADELEGAGNWVWAPHDTEGWVPGQVTQTYADGSFDLQLQDGAIENFPAGTETVTCYQSSLKRSVPDLVQMDDVNEAMIAHNLKLRFQNDEIYTNIGTILISVNPYRRLPLYTPSKIDEYAHKGNRTLPPHVFSIASDAYSQLLDMKKDQSILISGESGAGKTEATKQCLMFFAEVAGSTSGVEQNILLANPILEAFGNAKTLRNNNSSRFGKWIEVHFDEQARICGASTINYLLEKSRVVYQAEGERNFHIFYMLLAGASPEQRAKWHLWSPEDYTYTNQSGCITLDDVDDAKEFDDMVDAMHRLNFKEEHIDHLLRMVAAILHLGNLDPQTAGSGDRNVKVEASQIVNKDELAIAAELLQVPPAQLEEALTSRLMEIRGQEATRIPLNPDKAIDAINALAKQIYNHMFDWLVKRVNESMAPPPGSSKSCIGVLDIFGFEIFEINSFEQMCINFANEKLQQHFNQHTFKLEEQLYRAEKIQYNHVEFIDNQPVLDLIEQKPHGVMIVLDDEIGVPRGSDAGFLNKINQKHGRSSPNPHPNFSQMMKSQTDFTINHYAGAVVYDSTGYLEKNRDTLNADLQLLLYCSKNSLLNELFPPPRGGRRGDDGARTRKITLGGQFRQQLDALMKALHATEPHYIRCVKPNPNKAAKEYFGRMCLDQLRYAGVFEAVTIRQTGFPFRWTHVEFIKRYGFIRPEAAGSVQGDVKGSVRALLAALPGDYSAAQIGSTRVLYRAKEHRSLELARNVAVEAKSIILQAYERTFRAQRMARRLFEVKPVLEQAMATRTLEALDAALQQAADVDFEMKQLSDARNLREVVRKELDITSRLNSLMPQDHEVVYEQLAKAVSDADEISFNPQLVQKAREVVELIRRRRECRANLKTGTEKSDRTLLEPALAEADALQMPASDPVVAAARAELARIVEEEAWVAELEAALNAGFATRLDDTNWDHSQVDVTYLDQAIAGAQQFGMRTAAGTRRLREAEIVRQVRTCLVAEDWETLGVHLKQATSIQFASLEIQEAQEELSHKVAVDDVVARLVSGVENHDQDELAYALEQADHLKMEHPEVELGRAMLASIVQTRQLLQEAIAAVQEPQLQQAVDAAASFNFHNDEVATATDLLAKVQEAKREAATGLHYLERPHLEAAVEQADAINMEHAIIEECRGYLCLSMDKFLQEQLKKAKQLNDPARAIRLTIKMKDMFFATHGKMFIFKTYGNLRNPEAYAKAKLFGRDQLKLNMLQWTKQPIPTSLTHLPGVFAKQATKLFKNILGFAGDRSLSYPETLAQDLINQGLATPEIRDEIYCQLIKQLTDNPNPQSVLKIWNLMEFCLQTFPPGDDFGNYLEMYLRNHGASEKYIFMLHDTQYGVKKSTAPLVEHMMKQSDYKPYILVDAPTEVDVSQVVVAEGLLDAALPAAIVPITGGSIPAAAATASSAASTFTPPPAEAAATHAAQAVAVANAVAPPPALEEQPAPPNSARQLPQARALYDYEAQDYRQISIAVGDVVTILEGESPYEGWWMVTLNGNRGIAPSNYMERL